MVVLHARLHQQIYKWSITEEKDLEWISQHTHISTEYIQDIIDNKKKTSTTKRSE